IRAAWLRRWVTVVAMGLALVGCAGKADDGAVGEAREGVTPNACSSNKCLIGGTCYNNGTINPANDCQSCNSNVSTTDWTNLSSATSCASDGISCTSDACDGAGTCTHTLQSGNCLIGGVCYTNSTANPANGCQRCASSTSTSTWTNRSSSTACTT